MNLRKIFLIVLLISLAAAALVGIGGVVFSRYPDEKLIFTMLSIGLFSLTMLGSAIVLDKRRWKIAMICSLAISGFGVALFLFDIWFSREMPWQLDILIVRLMGQTATVAVALPLAGLMALTRFDGTLLRFVRLAVITIVFIAAGTFTVPIWFEDHLGNEFTRFLSVVLISTGLGVVGLPLLHKLAGLPPPSETVAGDLKMSITCPRCGESQTVGTGQSRCVRCRLRFVIEIEEPRCPKCSYLLFQLTEPRCPECGQALRPDDVMAAPPPAPPPPSAPPSAPPSPPPSAPVAPVA